MSSFHRATRHWSNRRTAVVRGNAIDHRLGRLTTHAGTVLSLARGRSAHPEYTKFFSYGVAGETGLLQLSQSVLDSWHYNLGAIGLTATSSLELEYGWCEPNEPYAANSSSGGFPTLPDDVTSHN